MKRIVALAILGTAAVNAIGQGHVVISNYLIPPYNQVVWQDGLAVVGGTAVNDVAVSLSFWYAAGVATADQLVQGNSFSVDPTLTYDPSMGHGPGGYYSAIFLSPAVGDYTVQVRASGNVPGIGDVFGGSDLFQVTTTSTGLPADTANISPGLLVVVPEPTTLALAGLGAAALLVLRRRS